MAILLPVLAIPMAASAYLLATRLPSPSVMHALGLFNAGCAAGAVVLFIVLARMELVMKGKMRGEARRERWHPLVMLFAGFLVAQYEVALGITSPALGLVVSGAAIAWVLLWLPPQLRRVKTVTSYVIHRGPEMVFNFVTDLRNSPRWVEGSESDVMLSPEPIGAGSRFQVHGTLGNTKIEAVEEIVSYEPSRQMSYRLVDRDRPNLATYTFEPVDGGTLFTYRFDYEHSVASAVLGALFRQPRVERRIQARRAGDRVRLAAILENAEG